MEGDGKQTALVMRESTFGVGLDELQRRIDDIHTHITQISREASEVQELFNTTIAAQTPLVSQDWPGVFAALSSAAEGLRVIREGVKGTCRPVGWAAPKKSANIASADGLLPPDVVWRRDIYPMLSVCEAVCSARPTSKTYGTQGGGVWQEMADFIRVAAIYKLTGDGLPLVLSPQWMADHLATKAAFDELPLALAIYNTFGHLLSYQGTTLELRRVDDDTDDSDQDSDSDGDDEDMEGAGSDQDEDMNEQGDEEGSDEEGAEDRSVWSEPEGQHGAGEEVEGEAAGGDRGQPGGGGGDVTRQRYRIGDMDFTTTTRPLAGFTFSADPSRHSSSGWSWRSGVVRKGVEKKRVLYADVGLDDTRYLSLLTEPIEGHKTIDHMDQQGQGSRRRYIILKGTEATDTIVAHLWLVDGSIYLYTTEAPIEGNTAIERFPVAVAAARPLLTKYGLERAVLG
ncbi:unnamed protein product [Vitrella brassicaformis CCMP3155]|uniref:Uncharacterized protein n=1 Tax=Vitrella brassicaformis (strain CCMP3155) TaxID=1169540 RepID=A0A0G4ENQ4_VITBC|nr:unnamed protein product [Vitrella brassicaformis CCMP3155]|eukprot:CEL98592.1 unnamed protein product [Vitrella brassicaformis CCMP3155]